MTVTIQTRHGATTAPDVIWQGQALAVHRNISVDGNGDHIVGQGWAITHLATGYRAAESGDKRKAQRFAKRWDDRFLLIRTAKDTRGWVHGPVFEQEQQALL